MASIDIAGAVMDALEAHWQTARPTWSATLHADEKLSPKTGSPTVLIADDGGTAVHAGAWMVGKTLRRRTLRFTAYAEGRDEARSTVEEAVGHIVTNRPAGLTRIEDVSDPLITRDRATGTFLGSVTVQVTVKPITA